MDDLEKLISTETYPRHFSRLMLLSSVLNLVVIVLLFLTQAQLTTVRNAHDSMHESCVVAFQHRTKIPECVAVMKAK